MALLKALALLVIISVSAPIFWGLLGLIRPAFGLFPALDLQEPTLTYFGQAFAQPGISKAIWLSFSTGLMATAISLGLVFLALARLASTRSFDRLLSLLPPLLAVPHAAAAFGLAFLIAPSGWIARLIALPTGIERPVDLIIVNDPIGLSLVLGLVLKEVPFLFLMAVAALSQVNQTQSRQLVASLGYRGATGWLKAIGPQIYHRMRLPVLAVLCFSTSVVDVALILGPTTPPTLAVLITRAMSSPDISQRLVGSALALIQLGVLFASIGLWRAMELSLGRLIRAWIWRGDRKGAELSALVGGGLALAIMVMLLLGLVALCMWSVAGFWSFPALWPSSFSGRTWVRFGAEVVAVLGPTLAIAITVSLVSIVFALALLASNLNWRNLVLLGLLVPQVVFLPGISNFMLVTGLQPSSFAVALVHVVFVLPYVLLSLEGPYNGLDRRYEKVANSLGKGPIGVFFRIRVVMLTTPILTAFAIGVAVSVSLYLPTLLIGSGRVATLATESVALASGGDRRVIGLYGVAQVGAAILPFGLSLLLPLWVWRDRKGMQHG